MKVKTKVRGKEIDIGAELMIGPDLDKEMNRAAANVAYYGSLLSDVQADLAQVNAEYRHWRARQVGAILEQDPKLAEWKVRAKVEALDQFMQHKEAIANAEEETHGLWAAYEAFQRKVDMLRSRSARERDHLAAVGGMTDTPSGTKEAATDERKRRLSEVIGKDKKSKKGPKRERPKKS